MKQLFQPYRFHVSKREWRLFWDQSCPRCHKYGRPMWGYFNKLSMRNLIICPICDGAMIANEKTHMIKEEIISGRICVTK